MTRRKFIGTSIAGVTCSALGSPTRGSLGAREQQYNDENALPYDSGVEYLESTGTQWIATGLRGKQGYDFFYRVNFTNLSSSVATGIGGEFENGMSCYIGLVRINFTLAYHYKDTRSPIVVKQNVQSGVDYDIHAHLYPEDQYFVVDGVKSSVGRIAGNFTSNLYMRLFCINSVSPVYSFLRLSYCSIYDNGELVRDFRPVRFTNEYGEPEGAMYDGVSGGLFRNAGSGAFIIGPDV